MRQLITTNTPRFGRVLPAVFLAAFMAVCVLLVAKPAHAQFIVVFTVNSTGDEPDASAGDNSCDVDTSTPEEQCTLRAAIQDANANGTTVPDFIAFNIPGSGVKTISPATLLPLVKQPVTIDGYTQPGARKNTLAVGDNADLRIRLDKGSGSAGSGLWIDTNDSVVRGLSITGFSSGVGLIVDGDNNTVEGNFLGTDPSGTLAGVGNYTGVIMSGQSSNNLVGGTSPEARNVISGNSREGVRINTDPFEEGNRVQGNYIGTTRSGTGDLGNTSAGVTVNSFADSENLIGDTTRAGANTIAFNGTGVEVGDGFVPTGISILGNSIFSNDALGIDLNGDGITPNDSPSDADTGPNNLQNFPVITSAKTGRRATTIKGTLDSTQNGTFTIQFFKNPKSNGNEGKEFIGETSVTDTDGDGIISFTFKPANKVKAGMFVTATATDQATSDTSEFSLAKRVVRS
jgi:CSLREA domain-containing protein